MAQQEQNRSVQELQMRSARLNKISPPQETTGRSRKYGIID